MSNISEFEELAIEGLKYEGNILEQFPNKENSFYKYLLMLDNQQSDNSQAKFGTPNSNEYIKAAFQYYSNNSFHNPMTVNPDGTVKNIGQWLTPSGNIKPEYLTKNNKLTWEALKEWKNYDINSLPYYHKQYLRLKRNGWNDGEWSGDVQTSLNVTIPIETFKKYYSILKRGDSLIGQKISHYRVNKQDDKLLTIGCHKIELSEIHSIANQIKVV